DWRARGRIEGVGPFSDFSDAIEKAIAECEARSVAHSDETRAAVLAALLAGQSITEVAKQYRIGRATVIAWRDVAGASSTPVQHQKRMNGGTWRCGRSLR